MSDAPEKKRDAGFHIYSMRVALDYAEVAITMRGGRDAPRLAFPFLRPTCEALQVHSTAPGAGFPCDRKPEAEERRIREIAIGKLEGVEIVLPAFRPLTPEIELLTFCQDALQLARLILKQHVEHLDERWEKMAQKLSEDIGRWVVEYEARPTLA